MVVGHNHISQQAQGQKDKNMKTPIEAYLSEIDKLPESNRLKAHQDALLEIESRIESIQLDN